MKTIITILLLTFTMALSAQLKPSIVISDAKVRVFDYHTGETLNKYKLSEISVKETKIGGDKETYKYLEIGIMGDTSTNENYEIKDLSYNNAYHFLELDSDSSKVIMRISKRKRGDVQMLVGNELHYIRGTIVTRNL